MAISNSIFFYLWLKHRINFFSTDFPVLFLTHASGWLVEVDLRGKRCKLLHSCTLAKHLLPHKASFCLHMFLCLFCARIWSTYGFLAKIYFVYFLLLNSFLWFDVIAFWYCAGNYGQSLSLSWILILFVLRLGTIKSQ